MEKLQYLLTGGDPGNSDTKISFLNADGNITDFSIPTCYAVAPTERSVLNRKRANCDPTDNLHVEIIPSNGAFPRGTYYVGNAAKLAAERIEPGTGDKATSDVHLITLVVGQALAALLAGIRGEVCIPPSVGLPIDDIKAKQGAVFLNRLAGSFKINFLDGVFAGETITLHHVIDSQLPVETYIHAEAIKAPLGLGFDFDRYELKSTELVELADSDVVISDPGGKSFDIAVYEGEDLDSSASTTYESAPESFAKLEETKELVGHPIGANYYIDKAHEVAVEEIKRVLKENMVPVLTDTFFRGRHDFISKVLKPYTKQLQEQKTDKTNKKSSEPRITCTISNIQIDLTEKLVPLLDTYGEIIYYMNLLARQERGASHIPNNLIIGGGVLLGYRVLKERETNSKNVKMYHLPSNIFIAPYINSRSYLIDSFLTHEEIASQIKNAAVANK